MREKLEKLLENSYAPYSNMHFACIVETKSGNFYNGVNVENASYGATVCAERSAILNAVSHGEREFKTLYLMTDLDHICYPCGACKQVISEFFDKDALFNIMTKSGEMEVVSYEKMMSTYFTKEDMQ
jgi:cytidine deaminase